MSRQERKRSESGIYHVTLRGINQMQLFYDDEDRTAFLERLSRYKTECGYLLFAWCLMGNHVHLLIQETQTALPVIMKKLALSYSHYYNHKYDRQGYLFQDRYGSKPVDSDEYLLAAVRYIHRNPLEISQPMSFWTSYNDYLFTPELTDTAFILGLFDDDIKKARREFTEFLETEQDDSHPYSSSMPRVRMRDTEAIAAILETSGLESCAALATIDKEAQTRIIVALKAQHLSIRQIARLTGISRGIVMRAKRQ